MPPRQRKGKASGAMRKQSGAKPIPPRFFNYRLLARLILFYTTSLAVKKHLPTAKQILLTVAAVNKVGTALKYLHCYNNVNVFWMFLTKFSKLPKLTKFPIFSGL